MYFNAVFLEGKSHGKSSREQAVEQIPDLQDYITM